MERAWPGTVVEESNLSVQISALRRLLGDGADSLIVTVPRIGYRLVAPERAEPERGIPCLAVLPFTNHGDLSEDGYFASGVADDIITELSRFRSFAVASRSASHALANNADVLVAAAKQGVRYALEGSVRRAGQRNGGVLVDAWHHFRGAADPDMLREIPPQHIVAVQIDDGAATPVGEPFEDTILRRRLPGEGDFDLVGLIRLLDDLGVSAPISVEIIAPDFHALPVEEAAQRATDATRAVLARARG